MDSGQGCRGGWILGLVLASGVANLAAAPSASQPAADPCRGDICQAALYLAVSDDGLTFQSSGILLGRAAAPELIRLPNRSILAIFDRAPQSGDSESALAVARSTDDGKSWSPSRVIVWERGAKEAISARHASAVTMPSGWLRIYYCLPPSERSRAGCLVGSAVSRDAVHYRVDPQVHISFPEADDVHPCAANIDGQINLFLVGIQAGKDSGRPRVAVQHYISSNGSDCRFIERSSLDTRVTQIVRLDNQVSRALACRDHHIVSFLLEAGRWREEEGVRIKDATDAAMVARSDGAFLMLCVRRLDENASTQPASATKQESSEPLSADAGSLSAAAPAAPPESWEPFAPPIESPAGAGGGSGQAEMPPTTDLEHPIDYVEWYRQHSGADSPENAYHAYEPLLATEALWSQDDMAHQEADWEPAPWSPLDHPRWEAAYQVMSPFLQQFQLAAQSPAAFSTPIRFSSDSTPKEMTNMLLPYLHAFRNMVKATMSDAWREENGVVPPEQMRQAMQTSLLNANHANQGATIIDHLVSVGEKIWVYHHARYALVHGVFTTPEAIESALRTLQQSDGQDLRTTGWIPVERASFMCSIQSFMLLGPDGQPHVDVEKFRKTYYDGPEAKNWTTERQEKVSQLTVEQLRQGIETANAAWDRMRALWQGDYQTATPQLDQLDDQCQKSLPPIADSLLPSIMRVHQLATRAETSRRATQLVYHLHLYHAQHGQWPANLNQVLPPGDPVRIDPFTSRDYAYRLTPVGPRVYTLSNNGQDDGGVHSKYWADGPRPSGGSDDFVFWPPQ